MKTILVAFLFLTVPLLAQRRGQDKAPKVGSALPKVSAVTLKEGKTVDLSKPKRHTVLIFGSHT